LKSSADVSLPDPFNECLDHRNSFFAVEVLKVWVKIGPKEVGPVPPITVAFFVARCHHSVGDVVVHNVE